MSILYSSENFNSFYPELTVLQRFYSERTKGQINGQVKNSRYEDQSRESLLNGCLPGPLSPLDTYISQRKVSPSSSVATTLDTSPSDSGQNISSKRLIFNRERVNLESHKLVWLDEDNQFTLEFLRTIVDYTKVFDNIEECQQYIEQTNGTTTTFLSQLRILEEFQANYKPEDAIRWYTKDTFVYSILNKALRQHNIEAMFLFGFYIQDLYRQLAKEHKTFKLANLENSIIKVYRGQIISRREVMKIIWNNSNDDDFISKIINSFFSTSLNHNLASFYLNPSLQPDDELQSVLFEIDIDVREDSRPYANVSYLSEFGQEEEVLFMIGTKFVSTKSILYAEKEKRWIFAVELADDYFHSSTKIDTVKNYVKKHLRHMTDESVEDINSVFNGLVSFYPSERWILAVKFHSLANYYRGWKGKNYISAISNYCLALEVLLECICDDELNCTIEIGEIHNKIGWCYKYELQDYNMAKKHYDLSISYYQSVIEKLTTEDEKIKFVNLLEDIYEMKMDISIDENEKLENGLMLIKYKEQNLDYLLKSNLKNVVREIEDIGFVYESISKYDDALLNYVRAFEIYVQNNSYWVIIYNILVRIVSFIIEKKGDHRTALKYQLIKHEYMILRHNEALERTNNWRIGSRFNNLAKSHVELADYYIELQTYNLAHEHLTKALKLYQDIKLYNKKEDTIKELTEKIKTVQPFLE
ncbi:unnamed protein product [Didymodactylos carnosus]|uniref:Uncharacterized protein n=1 Tax=Didymodactylos carnosus TaxID=1234261 RepID=A0A814SB31_9BILA|nr:unnamed protein product [Didymodactylos carnosus]CAF1145843.1 unnamed protein product [Didymodactylos carnosus]CAF3672150.1 unnamed protein product [Didymodactylos carnosus]CAF3909442.1 unnamed protein product [Didymodactylos carnosus]